MDSLAGAGSASVVGATKAPSAHDLRRFLCLADFEAAARRLLPGCLFADLEQGAKENRSSLRASSARHC